MNVTVFEDHAIINTKFMYEVMLSTYFIVESDLQNVTTKNHHININAYK